MDLKPLDDPQIYQTERTYQQQLHRAIIDLLETIDECMPRLQSQLVEIYPTCGDKTGWHLDREIGWSHITISLIDYSGNPAFLLLRQDGVPTHLIEHGDKNYDYSRDIELMKQTPDQVRIMARDIRLAAGF